MSLTLASRPSRSSRRPGFRPLGAGLLAAALVLAGCAGDDNAESANGAENADNAPGDGSDNANTDNANTDDAANTGEDASTDDTAASPEGSAFPVTIDTAYGELTMEEAPERIVVLGFNYADMLHSIGLTPVATSAGPDVGDAAQLEAAYPWIDAETVGEIAPELAGPDRGASLEAIAAFEPDLILTNTWSVSPEVHEQASQIAPAFVGVSEGTTDWDETLEAIGELTGTSEEAAEVVSGVEAEYAAVRDELPELQDKTVNYFAYTEENGLYSGNSTWLHGFGLVPAENQDDTQRDTSAYLSLENLDQVTADVLVVWDSGGTQETLEADPRFAELPASRNGAVVFIDTPMAMATNSAGPGSLSWMIEQIAPEFAAAEFDGAGE